MNGKIGMRAFSLFLALLVSMNDRPNPSYRRACQWFDPLPKISVMYSFFNEVMSTTEFPSDDYYGDADHDNARRIRETKWTVANYHS